ncbi:MAG TPA: hypothetical protein VFC70_01750 [Oscillospiraceae bacterium]|nr:hypothetical protein [Oscillospiraceae bacterium]
MIETNPTIIFQLLNIAVIIVVIYAIYYLVVKLPRNLREKNAKLSNIERTLDEINKKIDK